MKTERIERGEWYFYIQPSTLLPRAEILMQIIMFNEIIY